MAEGRPSGGSAVLGPLLGFAAGLAAAGLTFVSGVLDREVRDRQVDVEVMRVAFDVLQLPIEQTGRTYRRWACEVLNEHTTPALDCSSEDAENAVLGEASRFGGFGVGARDSGPATAADIGLFICEAGDEAAARRAAEALRGDGFGDITLRRWNLFSEIPREALSGAATIVFDADHPERFEAPRIEAALAEAGFAKVARRANTGPQTRWFITVILCDV